jgi:hypothetical protein
MSYQISYDDGTPISIRRWRNEEPVRIETFGTEGEALSRARQLLDGGDHHAVVVCDEAGNTLGGIRLQLRLGFSAE